MHSALIYATIVGTKVANPDQQTREKLFAACRKGELLCLEREENNPHDPEAIAVLRQSREKLGYVSKEAAHEIVQEIDAQGQEFEAVIAPPGSKSSSPEKSPDPATTPGSSSIFQEGLQQPFRKTTAIPSNCLSTLKVNREGDAPAEPVTGFRRSQ